jgi:hypothetical protein
MGDTKTKRLGIALTASEAFVRDMGKVMSVPPHVLLKVAAYVNTDHGMSISDTEDLLAIWRESGLSVDDLSSTYDVLRHLFKASIKKKVTVDFLLQEISEFCAERGILGFEERRESLRAFLEPKPEYLKQMQFVDFAFGVMPTLESISGVVQLRAAFADKNSPVLIGYVPVVQVRLGVEDTESEESKTFVFQTDEPGLRNLLKYLRIYETQLSTVKDAVAGKIETYTRPERDDSK